MLQVLRGSMKYLSWILWTVIAIFVLYVFVDFGRGSRVGGKGATDAAATVGGQPITRQEFERERQNLEDRVRQQLGQQYSPELVEQLQLPMQALNRLVTNRILLAEADKMGFEVSDRELRRYILNLPLFQDEQGNFVGTQRYQQLVRRVGYTPESFEKAIRESMLLERVKGALEGSVVVTDKDVEESYRQQNEKTKLRYVSVPFAPPAQAPPANDAELQSWLDKHREQYRVPDQRVADYVLVDETKVQQSLALTDAELRAYYEQHKEDYAQPEQMHARHILLADAATAQATLARLNAGADFAQVAREVSTDKVSGANGGDLGWFGRGRMVRPFEQAALAAPVGQVVGPVQSQFGYHLIQVLERRATGSTPFDEVKQAVRMRLAAERSTGLTEGRAKTIAAD
ncbi:MAG TPA: SurA N-terminal domain-containing protein, partial [Thermoanaerobaculia bacterium]|nr:SurA N-terminal domain-containing protein [Thermoanaerobaculia bacterium]